MTADLQHIQSLIAEGDEKALASLYQLFSKRLLHFATLLTRSAALAEEIVEDTFVKLWSRREEIRTIANLNVYLYVAVKNRSLNAIAHKARELVSIPFDHLEIDIGQQACDPYTLLITSEMMQRMQQAVDALPARCKMIFKLVRQDGLSYKEVADILNISVNTIDVQMAIAVKKICTALHLSGHLPAANPKHTAR
ncbi:MAG TPA: RNA polymerase sigma-70 factor [Chitinophagaceae bacterium]|nr:RNA polymerase sigma-70 factor [Chitinophagaceae bacterium]